MKRPRPSHRRCHAPNKKGGVKLKLRLWAAVVIFVSSYSPLGIILFIKDFAPASFKLRHPISSSIILSVAVLSAFILLLTMRNIRHGDLIKIERISNQSGQLVNYTIPYMISFFGFDIGDLRASLSFFVFMALMFILTIRTQNIFINPLLALLGYGLYDVEYRKGDQTWHATFLSKNDFFKGDYCLVRDVSRFLYVVTRVNPEV